MKKFLIFSILLLAFMACAFQTARKTPTTVEEIEIPIVVVKNSRPGADHVYKHEPPWHP